MITEAEILGRAEPIDRKVGIYFLIRDGEIIYVGKSTNIVARVFSHRWEGKEFDAWSWVECDWFDMDATERAYIDALHPYLNTDAITRASRGLKGLRSIRTGRGKPVETPAGRYESAAAAALALGVTRQAVSQKIGAGRPDWRLA